MTRQQFISQVECSQKAFRRYLTALCCGDSALADDIAQEALMKAYVARDSLGDMSKFGAWIYRIGYNTFLTHRRCERYTEDISEARSTAAVDTADGAFRYQALYGALDRLPAKERSAILLFYLDGYAIKEICAIISASEAAVKQYLSRGRNHLRQYLSVNE